MVMFSVNYHKSSPLNYGSNFLLLNVWHQNICIFITDNSWHGARWPLWFKARAMIRMTRIVTRWKMWLETRVRMRTRTVMMRTETGLIPRPSWKVERGSGVLIDWHFLSHGEGLQHKECHNYILHPGLEFSDDLDSARYGLQMLDKAAKSLGKLRTSSKVSFSTSNSVQNTIAYIMHI